MSGKDESQSNPGPDFSPAFLQLIQTLALWSREQMEGQKGSPQQLFGLALGAITTAMMESVCKKDLAPINSLVCHMADWCGERQVPHTPGKTIADLCYGESAKRFGTNNQAPGGRATRQERG